MIVCWAPMSGASTTGLTRREFSSAGSTRAADALPKQLNQQISMVNDEGGWEGPKLEFNDSIKTKLAQVRFYQRL